MRLAGGHENHLTAMHAMGLAGDDDLRLAFDDLHQRVERGGVLAQLDAP